MTIVGIKRTGKPNYAYLDTLLPLNFFKGSLSISLNWEQHPTGTLNIQSVSESEIDTFRNIYNVVGKTFSIFQETSRPIFFEIAAYAETEDAIFIDSTNIIKSYNISISLRGGHETNLSTNYQVKKPIKVFKNSANKIYGRSSRSSVTSVNFIPNDNNQEVTPPVFDISSKVKGNKLNLKDFAELVGANYQGYSYAIEIPEDAGSDYRLNFSDALQAELRINQQIVDYNEPAIKTRNYKAGRVWKINSQDILYAIELSKQRLYEYRDTVLSGKDGLPFLSPSQRRERTLDQLMNGQSSRKPPNLLILEESDADVPSVPPADLKQLVSLDMNADFSGTRINYKRTKTLNGQPIEEELFVYGLAYLAQDIRNLAAEAPDADFDTPALLGNPANFWQLIEYTKTTYIYTESNVTISIKARDKRTNQLLPVKYLDGKSFDSRYLSTIKTTGWKLTRFQQEQFDEFGSGNTDLDSRWLTETIANDGDELNVAYSRAQLDSITFRRVPYSSTTQYKLVPATNYYEDVDPVPFSTSEIERKDLGFEGTGTVVAAVPDPSFVYPMLVLEERTLTQSFMQMDHPQNILIRDERAAVIADGTLSTTDKEDALRDLKLLPWLTTGEDTYKATIRKILPSKNTSSRNVGKDKDQDNDIYLEYDISASNQDAKFQYSLQQGSFRTIAGRPPSATVFSYSYEDSSDTDQDDTDPFNYEYVVNSTKDEFNTSVESLQYNTDDLDKGLAAAKADLEINNFLNVFEDNVNLAWFYPEIRPGDYIEFTDDINKGKLRVKSMSLNIDYQDHVNGLTHRICSGTNLTCGRFEEKDITHNRRNKDDNNDGFDVTSSVRGEDTIGLSIYPALRTRRNPSGVAIE